jgi:hypothetical protein
MAFTPFDMEMGARQGRLKPSGWTPTSGEYAFVLGSNLPGHIHRLEAGDHCEVSQEMDLTGVNFIRARLRLRNASFLPAGLNWEASILVDGMKKATMTVEPGKTRDRADMAANVSKLTGMHSVAVRLELIEVSGGLWPIILP